VTRAAHRLILALPTNEKVTVGRIVATAGLHDRAVVTAAQELARLRFLHVTWPTAEAQRWGNRTQLQLTPSGKSRKAAALLATLPAIRPPGRRQEGA
jgi:hypothetical protein